MTATQTAGPALPPGGAGPTPPVLIMAQCEIDRNRGAWLTERTSGITGTDTAILLGLSAHMGPFDLYHAKLDGIETADRPVMRRGRLLEPEIDSLLQDAHPWLNPRPAGLYASGQIPWMMATLDRWVLDTEAMSALDAELIRDVSPGRAVLHRIDAARPAEYKTWATEDGWTDTDGDGNIPGAMPIGVRCQAIWNMHVAGADEILVVVLFMQTWRLRVYTITAGDPGVRRDLDVMIAEAAAFRQRLLDHDEPPVDELSAPTLRALFPGYAEGERVIIPRWLAARYWRARRAKAAADRRLKRWQNEIRLRMGDAQQAVAWADTDRGRRLVKVCSRSVGDHQVKAFTRHDDKINPGSWTP